MCASTNRTVCDVMCVSYHINLISTTIIPPTHLVQHAPLLHKPRLQPFQRRLLLLLRLGAIATTGGGGGGWLVLLHGCRSAAVVPSARSSGIVS
jgi:hypothetical protein